MRDNQPDIELAVLDIELGSDDQPGEPGAQPRAQPNVEPGEPSAQPSAQPNAEPVAAECHPLQHAQLAALVGAFKAKYMYSNDTDAKYEACKAYIEHIRQNVELTQGQRYEFDALSAELRVHMRHCGEARQSTVSGIIQIMFGIITIIIMIFKFLSDENLIVGIPVFAHIVWAICRMSMWYADLFNVPFAVVEFVLGSCLIYTIHIWPTGGKVLGCLMYLIFASQIAAVFNSHNPRQQY